ncbi:hypothetical protein D3C85_1619960 [compost metagenome]
MIIQRDIDLSIRCARIDGIAGRKQAAGVDEGQGLPVPVGAPDRVVRCYVDACIDYCNGGLGGADGAIVDDLIVLMKRYAIDQ